MQLSEFAFKLSLVWEHCRDQLVTVLWSPTSNLSLISLLSTLVVATAFVAFGRVRRQKTLKPRVLVRALFPRRWLIGPSARADLGLAALNVFITAALIGWAIVSAAYVEQLASTSLERAFGSGPLLTVSPEVLALVLSVAFFFSFELAYFVDHFSSHKITFFWHFHRVHHTAETLSPVTNFRVHPVDSLKFYNIVALFTGLSAGLTRQFIGAPEGQSSLSGITMVLIWAAILLTHLQHSHVWMAFAGRLGRLILSPAHHQIHHSSEPRHFGRNFGNVLAIFDRLAGTLYVPTARREQLRFGVGATAHEPHGVTGTLLRPFMDAGAVGTQWVWRRRWSGRFRRDINRGFA